MYQNIDREQLKELVPHHLVALRENGDRRCPRLPRNPSKNVCAEARGILQKYGINIIDSADNGVLLPSMTDLNHSVAPDFFKRYPCATVHTTRLNNEPLFHNDAYYEKVYQRLDNAQRKGGGNATRTKLELQAALQQISIDLLEGAFVKQNYSHRNRGVNVGGPDCTTIRLRP